MNQVVNNSQRILEGLGNSAPHLIKLPWYHGKQIFFIWFTHLHPPLRDWVRGSVTLYLNNIGYLILVKNLGLIMRIISHVYIQAKANLS